MSKELRIRNFTTLVQISFPLCTTVSFIPTYVIQKYLSISKVFAPQWEMLDSVVLDYSVLVQPKIT